MADATKEQLTVEKIDQWREHFSMSYGEKSMRQLNRLCDLAAERCKLSDEGDEGHLAAIANKYLSFVHAAKRGREREFDLNEIAQLARHALRPPAPLAAGAHERKLFASDSYCPKCGHNRNTSAVSSIDHNDGTQSCQNCNARWIERDDPSASAPEESITQAQIDLRCGEIASSLLKAAYEQDHSHNPAPAESDARDRGMTHSGCNYSAYRERSAGQAAFDALPQPQKPVEERGMSDTFAEVVEHYNGITDRAEPGDHEWDFVMTAVDYRTLRDEIARVKEVEFPARLDNVGADFKSRIADLTSQLAAEQRRADDLKQDRQYHMNALNSIAKKLGVLGETSEVVSTAVTAWVDFAKAKVVELEQRAQDAAGVAFETAARICDEIERAVAMKRAHWIGTAHAEFHAGGGDAVSSCITAIRAQIAQPERVAQLLLYAERYEEFRRIVYIDKDESFDAYHEDQMDAELDRRISIRRQAK